jgi:hypothetical protein
MAERTTTSHGFGIEPARAEPIARIFPQDLVKVLGAIINLDGRASSSPDGEDLTYEWVLIQTPLGSEVEALDVIEEDGSVVKLTPDKTGAYVIGLVVSTLFRSSERATTTVEIQAAVIPYTAQLTPDASWIFNIISDFWTLVEDRRTFETLWSGYIQVVAAEMLRLFQVDYAKSISTIQPLFQRRWLGYFPRIDLDANLLTGIVGYEQSGDTAFTGSSADLARGLLVSQTEFRLIETIPSSDAVGTELRIFSSLGSPGNVGTYLINRINTRNNGYFVSVATPFPDFAVEVALEGSTLTTFKLDPVVRLGVDAVVNGVEIGDFLHIRSGSDSGYFEIIKVGTPDGLTNDSFVEISTPAVVTLTNRNFGVVRSVRASFQRIKKPDTGTVFIPQADADLTLFETVSFKGRGTISSVFELLVESRHIFDAVVGNVIRVTSGENGGRSYTIAAVNDARTGYAIGASFVGTFPQSVSYEIPIVSDISSRLLILDGRAHEIVSARLDEALPPISEGGRGSLWVISLAEETAPANREGLTWRIADTLISDDANEDFEKKGIMPNDLLVFGIQVVGGLQESTIRCTVLGAVKNKLAFLIGTVPQEPGENGGFSDEDVLRLSIELQVPAVVTDPITGELIYVDQANEIRILLNSTSFRKNNFNLPISNEKEIDLDVITVKFVSGYIVRNSRIPVDETVASVPALFEYISKPEVGQDVDGNVILVGKNGAEVIIQGTPLVLLENRDFTVGAEKSISSANAETTADSDIISLPFADLLDRDVRGGDSLDLLSGFDQERYVVVEVLDDERVRVLTENGEVPHNDATGLSYTLIRRTPGKFIRFASELFTPALPISDHLWAENTFFDNSPYIEDNFGVLVNITKEQLDEFGASQVTYRGVVSGLMYSFTSGPTLEAVTIGSHFLLGLPVTEVVGLVVDVNDNYAEGRGRIMIEDLDPEGEQTGLVRIYFYVPQGAEALEEFIGLSTNPNTGRAWTVGDTVPQFTPLSKGLTISDYVADPTWWQVGGATGARELGKYHTWRVAMDTQQVDSRDIALVFDFLSAIRPVYTKPEIVAVIFLLDVIRVEDVFIREDSLFFFDDPAFSIEATHMLDSVGSPARRILDIGSLGMRTLFRGDDLIITAGSGTVSSARGGFLTDGTLPYINEKFEDEVTVRGFPLVRADTAAVPGDLLFIPFGPNAGRFEVTGVPDDNTLVVAAYPGDIPPRTFDPLEFEDDSDRTFYIQRIDSNPLVEGTATATIGSDKIIDSAASFQWDGIAVDDVLLVPSGANFGVYRIVRVGEDNGFGVIINLDTTLVVTPDMPATDPAMPYTIERDALRKNPLLPSTSGGKVSGGQVWSPTSPSGSGYALLRIQRGDKLRILSGSEVGKEFTIIHVPPGTFDIYVSEPFVTTEATGVLVEVVRDLLDTESHDSDFIFEKLFAFDNVEMTLFRPMSVFLTVTDLTLAFDVATSAATDLQTAGVTTAMRLQIDNAHVSSGVYEISIVSGFSVTTTMPFPLDETPVTADFLTDDLEFAAAGATVTSAGAFNYETMGILPGDILSLAVGEFVIMTVSGGTLVLTQTTGLASTVAGNIIRRLLPC